MSDPGKSQPMTVNEECGRGNSGLPLIDFGGQPPILRQSSTTVVSSQDVILLHFSFHLPTVSVLEFFNVSISLFQFSFFLFLFLPPTLNQSVCHEISQVINPHELAKKPPSQPTDKARAAHVALQTHRSKSFLPTNPCAAASHASAKTRERCSFWGSFCDESGSLRACG